MLGKGDLMGLREFNQSLSELSTQNPHSSAIIYQPPTPENKPSTNIDNVMPFIFLLLIVSSLGFFVRYIFYSNRLETFREKVRNILLHSSFANELNLTTLFYWFFLVLTFEKVMFKFFYNDNISVMSVIILAGTTTFLIFQASKIYQRKIRDIATNTNITQFKLFTNSTFSTFILFLLLNIILTSLVIYGFLTAYYYPFRDGIDILTLLLVSMPISLHYLLVFMHFRAKNSVEIRINADRDYNNTCNVDNNPIGISGGLLFYIYYLRVIKPFIAIMYFFASYGNYCSIRDNNHINAELLHDIYSAMIFASIVNLSIVVFGIYVGKKMYEKTKSSLETAKNYIIIEFFTYNLTFILTTYFITGIYNPDNKWVINIIGSLIWSSAQFFYLSRSRRVISTFIY